MSVTRSVATKEKEIESLRVRLTLDHEPDTAEVFLTHDAGFFVTDSAGRRSGSSGLDKPWVEEIPQAKVDVNVDVTKYYGKEILPPSRFVEVRPSNGVYQIEVSGSTTSSYFLTVVARIGDESSGWMVPIETTSGVVDRLEIDTAGGLNEVKLQWEVPRGSGSREERRGICNKTIFSSD